MLTREDSKRRKYGWAVGTIVVIALANFLITLSLIFFDYGATIEASEAGVVASRSPFLEVLYYLFAPLLAIPIRMDGLFPGGAFVLVLNSVLWSTGVYLLILLIARFVSKRG